MKSIAALALILAAASVAPAFAQGNGVQAQIPFAFNISGATLPAGTYLIRAGSSGVLALLNRDHGSSTMTLARAGDGVGVKNNVLVFHRYGDEYFLSQIRSSTAPMNYTLSETKAEKRAKTSVEEAKLATSAPVLIALK